MASLFEKVPPGEGDEFAAVKPWLGAIKPPKPAPKIKAKDKEAPKEKLEIDWVYGYRSEEARMNCQFNSEGSAVYPTAAIGVVFDYKNMKQNYFGGGITDFGGRKQNDESKDGHSDDIMALSISNDRKWVASGQNGQKPLIFIWDAITGEPREENPKKRLPKGCRYVTAIGISAKNKYLAASDAAEKQEVHIFKFDKGSSAFATVTINQRITHLAWSPVTEESFANCGKDHVCFGSVKGDKIEKKMQQGDSQCAVAWSHSQGDSAFTGASDGSMQHFKGNKCIKKYPVCKGAVQSVACRMDKTAGEVVLVGGNDKSLTVFKFDGACTKMWNVVCDSKPLSLDLFNGNLLIAQKNGSISEMKFD